MQLWLLRPISPANKLIVDLFLLWAQAILTSKSRNKKVLLLPHLAILEGPRQRVTGSYGRLRITLGLLEHLSFLKQDIIYRQ